MTENTTYFDPARIITDPGAEYRAAARAFQGIPSIAYGPDRRLWAVWYGGSTPGEDENNYVVLAASADGGHSWSNERIVIDHADPVVRCFDPEVWRAPDGRLWVFWAQHAADNRFEGSRSGVWAITSATANGGETAWSEPRRLCDGVMMCKPLVLSNGEWTLPVSLWHRRESGSAAVVVSTDSGATWAERGAVDVPPEVRDHDEHMIVERRDGSLCTWVRTRDGIGESISRDGGRTWSELKSAPVPHVRSRFFLRRLRSGRLLLVRHDPANENFASENSRGTRSHLTAFLSDDDGATWSGGLLLDEREGVSYPDGDEAEDGTISVTYDFDRRGAREILMAAFREEDIVSGDAALGSLRRRVVINTAGAAARCFRVIPEDIPNRGIVFVDHQKHGRSGHGGNCLTQCPNGDILAFYSNVSGDLQKGHGTFGWSEYKRSTDGGRTWGEPVELEYSRRTYDGAEIGSALVFAATTAPDGTVVAFVFRFAEEGLWVKQQPPVVLLSHDNGRTWSEPRPLDPRASVEDVSLTFDAVFVRDGKIYIVFMGGSANYCPGPYSLYVSEDNGASFEKRSEPPFDAENYYVTAGVLDDGRIIVYSYPYKKGSAEIDEHDIPYVTSSDDGRTWSDVRTTRFAKRIRNMQMSEKIGDRYFLHGRSGSMGPSGEKGHLVLYCSRDGIHWDDGLILYRKQWGGGDCYSANTVVTSPDDSSRRLLIQSSIGYEAESSRVNEHHWWVTP